MPQISDSSESEWLSKLEAVGAFDEGPKGLHYALRSWQAWDAYINSVGLLSYPNGLGENDTLKDYVLFDFYDTSGQAVTKEASAKKPRDEVGSKSWYNPFGWGASEEEETQQAIKDGVSSALEGAGGDIDSQELIDTIGDAAEDVLNLLNPKVDPVALATANAGFGIRSYNATRLGFGANVNRIGLSIALPMPAKIDSNYGFEYEDTDFTGLANVVAAKDAIQKMSDGQSLGDEGKEVVRKMVSIPSGIVDDVSKIFGKGEVNLNAALDLKKRQAPNQFKEQVFKQVKRREFSFEYKFNPKSEKEALQIYAILYAFKKYTHPKRTAGGLYLDYPGQFKISFFDKLFLNDFLFRIGLCACTKCDISYGSGEDLSFFRTINQTSGIFDANSAMYGAPANEITMKLDFTELELLTRERIQQGY